MPNEYSVAELEAYLDEMLPAELAAEIERALRDHSTLQDQLQEINGRRDAGIHSLGEIWRRQRLTCPRREQLGGYLLDVLEQEHAEYIRFHLEVVACRYCNASAEDLRAAQAAAADDDSDHRRRKYFETSAGYLQREADG